MSLMPPPLVAAMPLEVGETWRRLHPLSPVVRFGRVLIGVLGIAVASIAEQPGVRHDRGLPISVIVYVGLLVLGGIGGVISWLVTRWRIADGNLQIETGFIRRGQKAIEIDRFTAVSNIKTSEFGALVVPHIQPGGIVPIDRISRHISIPVPGARIGQLPAPGIRVRRREPCQRG